MKKLLVIISMFMVFLVGYGKNAEINVRKGAKLPSFELMDFNRTKIKSHKILNNGNPTLLVFVAEWCPHCQHELPEIQRFYEENKDSVNVAVVFISKNTTMADSKKFIDENGFTFPVYYDLDRSLINAFKIKSVPYNLKIQNSVIHDIQIGVVSYDKLSELFSSGN